MIYKALADLHTQCTDGRTKIAAHEKFDGKLIAPESLKHFKRLEVIEEYDLDDAPDASEGLADFIGGGETEGKTDETEGKPGETAGNPEAKDKPDETAGKPEAKDKPAKPAKPGK